jgi:hypothetical protein
MIISVKNDNISLEPITQVCGTNIKRKNAIINNIVKYFSGSKYAEYDEMQAYDIRIDDKVVGRKYFNVYRIKSKEDLVCGIEISKTSLMRKYLDYINTQYDNQIVYENIVNEYMKIFKHINDEMEKSDINLYMDFLEEKINDICQIAVTKSNDYDYIENMSNIELYKEYMHVLKAFYIDNPEKILLILENVDHMLDRNEYKELIQELDCLTNELDINIISTMSIDGYVVINDYCSTGINIINDENYVLPELADMEKFFYNNYPCTYNLNRKNMILWLEKIVNYIGCELYTPIDREYVFLKLLNESIGMHFEKYNMKNNLENAFMQTV